MYNLLVGIFGKFHLSESMQIPDYAPTEHARNFEMWTRLNISMTAVVWWMYSTPSNICKLMAINRFKKQTSYTDFKLSREVRHPIQRYFLLNLILAKHSTFYFYSDHINRHPMHHPIACKIQFIYPFIPIFTC